MHEADLAALQILERVRSRFQLPSIIPENATDTLLLPPGILVGFETEVPWRAYFPHLWRKYFFDGKRTMADLTPQEKESLAVESRDAEAPVLERLGVTLECGVKRGRDHYWEFVLPPVGNLLYSALLLDALASAGLLPWGHWSLHATISGVASQKDIYVILLILELLFVRTRRIEQGFQGTWARKGSGGVLMKHGHQLLFGATSAQELRTLELPASPQRCKELFGAIASLLRHISLEAGGRKKFVRASAQLKRLLACHGLPFNDWGSPYTTPELWRRYIENLDAMRSTAREIAAHELDLVV